VDEEISGMGATTYFNDHISEMPNHVMAMESDGGNFNPVGFGFSGTKDAFAIITEIGNVLLSPIGAGNMTFGNGADSDTYQMVAAGVPGGNLISAGFETTGDNAYYFYFHHTNADTFTCIWPDGIRNSVAAFGVMSYVVADMEERLPH
jgi:carboxypeptidase Q